MSDQWQAVQGLHKEVPVSLPADVDASFLYRDVQIPAEASDHDVWLVVNPGCPYVMINGRMRYWDLSCSGIFARPESDEVNITPDIRLGQINRIVIGYGEMMHGWQTNKQHLTKVELRYYPRGSWCADGQSGLAALRPGELERIRKQQATWSPCSLINPEPAASEATPALTPAQAAPFTPPATLLDLDLAATDGPVIDPSLQKYTVNSHGTPEPFEEAGGAIRGVWLRGESAAPSWLEIPMPDEKLFHDEDFTLRVWVKPMAVRSSCGTVFNIYGDLFGGEINGAALNAWIYQPRAGHLTTEDVIRQQTWQCITLTVSGKEEKALAVYVNGVLVNRKGPVPVPGWGVVRTPLYIGAAHLGRLPFNGKVGAVTVYETAMSDKDVAALYESECPVYTMKPQAAWSELNSFCLDLSGEKPADGSDIPAELETGNGVALVQDDAGSYLSFSGKESYQLIHDQDCNRILSGPFSFEMEIRPGENKRGMIFRRHHYMCLSLINNDTLLFDASIGDRSRSKAEFPGIIEPGKWNRIWLSFDGQVVKIYKDGKLFGSQEYPIRFGNNGMALAIGADNTHPGFPNSLNTVFDVRKLRFLKQALPPE